MAWMGIRVEHGFFLHVFEPNDNTTYENAHKSNTGVRKIYGWGPRK